LPAKLLYMRNPQWSPDGRSLMVAGRDFKGRNGIYRIDVQTGDVSTVGYTDKDFPVLAQWSPDGNQVYYHSLTRMALIQHDLASGTEREIIQGPFVTRYRDLSPDGRSLAMAATNPATKASSLLLVSVADGRQKELLRLARSESWVHGIRNIAWTPDGRAVLVAKLVAGHPELWRVPADGATARRLDIDPEIWIKGAIGGMDRGFALSPDGRHIAFLMGKSAAEVWALENFLPRATETK
jgi:Tol biopolymer transport system component